MNTWIILCLKEVQRRRRPINGRIKDPDEGSSWSAVWAEEEEEEGAEEEASKKLERICYNSYQETRERSNST